MTPITTRHLLTPIAAAKAIGARNMGEFHRLLRDDISFPAPVKGVFLSDDISAWLSAKDAQDAQVANPPQPPSTVTTLQPTSSPRERRSGIDRRGGRRG